MYEDDPRLTQVEEKLRKYCSPEHVERAIRTIRTPSSSWTQNDHEFMAEVMKQVKNKESLPLNIGCWIMILVVIGLIVIAAIGN